MGDTTDGSSSAAQRAQTQVEQKKGGFLKRLFARSGTTEIVQHHTHEHITIMPAGGLGNLRNLRVDDVAIPRPDIVAVGNDIDLDGLVDVFRDSGYSRVPVYNETLDEPLGMIHLKDVALKHGFNGKTRQFNVEKMMRPLLFAPPSMPIGVLLQKMQTDRLHMALVIDEYGGVDGLVTIEDLVEQVVGEIADEHDAKEDEPWVEEKTGVYLVQARADLEDFEKVLGVDLLSDTEDEDIDTMGGLVFMLSGRVPTRGEVISHVSGYEFEVVDADPRSIKKLRVFKNSTSPA
ncbi:conjugation transfer protein [Amylibacter ulvae]|uniref:Conjugation transfer protein n=1 Tax=Paramylibacter ulvae TaxID=1651968 RepID=A0ABQ3D185_9RHOB|nr:hemolysin family protein [Amylibacter ulvae]GHA50404.1 conjugation transfer protein [Amylibacter ulvae]